MIEAMSYNGIQELSWSSKAGRQPSGGEVLSFAARNVHRMRKDSISFRGIRQAVARAYSIDGFTLVYSDSSGVGMLDQTEERDRGSIAEDQSDRVCLYAQMIGERRIDQGGQVQICSAGHAALYMTGAPYTAVTRPDDNRIEIVALYVPRKFVQRKIGMSLRDVVLEPSEYGNRFASDSLQLFAKYAWYLGEDDFLKMARSVSSMFLDIYCGDCDDRLAGQSVRATTLARIKDIITTHVCDPELSIGRLSDLSGISSNYIHKLFGEIGQTPWGYIKDQRLRIADTLLRDAESSAMSITEIAFSAGFSDSSYFSRAFKQAFGMTPMQARGMSRC